MSLDEFIDEKLGINKPEKKEKRKYTPKPKKLVIPNHIKILFDNLNKSISSIWGIQKNGKIKWDAKYNMWTSFKDWFNEISENDKTKKQT